MLWMLIHVHISDEDGQLIHADHHLHAHPLHLHKIITNASIMPITKVHSMGLMAELVTS